MVDIQRAGPSTGMPTKTEAADLLMALYGRHGESPLPVVAASTPADCFDAAIEAARIAVEHRTPVILLTDTFLANSSEPWRLPDVGSLPEIDPRFATEPNDGDASCPTRATRSSRAPGPCPARPGLRHRIGGLEKEDVTGNISYEPENHDAHDAPARGAQSRGSARCPTSRWTTRRRRRAAGARLGLELRRDPGRGPPRCAASRAEARDRARAPPQPAARQPRRGPALLRARAGARR